MKTIPLQLVVVELEDGQQGVFFGQPLLTDSELKADCGVQNVWFSNINTLPDGTSLEQLSLFAIEHFRGRNRPLH